MVQLPERINDIEIDLAEMGLNNLADVGKERIRKIVDQIERQKEEKEIDLQLSNSIGFKVFKLNNSNFTQWKKFEVNKTKEIVTLFDNFSDPLEKNWKKENLFNELLLLEGFPLVSQIEILENLLGNEIYRVSAPDFCEHHLFVCLDPEIKENTVELLPLEKKDIFICLDSALTDELKARVQDRYNVHVI